MVQDKSEAGLLANPGTREFLALESVDAMNCGIWEIGVKRLKRSQSFRSSVKAAKSLRW